MRPCAWHADGAPKVLQWQLSRSPAGRANRHSALAHYLKPGGLPRIVLYMWARPPLCFVLAVFALEGCSSEDESAPGTPIGCQWFEGDNCYKETVEAIYACVEAAQVGSFDTDQRVCSLPDGTAFTFASPPPLTFDDEGVWDFEITMDGAFCGSVRELGPAPDDPLVFESSLGEFRQELVGLELVLTCPDGDKYKIGALDSFMCDLSTLPGYGYSTTSDLLNFSLSGASSSDPLLYCQRP